MLFRGINPHFAAALLAASLSIAYSLARADEPAQAQQANEAIGRYQGAWQGSWLEGMSAGKISLQIPDRQGEQGQITITSLPWFGAAPAAVVGIAAANDGLTFQTIGSDGKALKFDLKPKSDGKALKGTARYLGSRMEINLARPESN